MKLLISNIVLQLLDGLTSYYGVFKYQLAVELNPLMVGIWSLIFLKILSVIILIIIYVGYRKMKCYRYVMWLYIIVGVYVVGDNLRYFF